MYKRIKNLLKYILLSFIAIISFYSCTEDSISPELLNSYMPLKVGNKWYYSSFSHSTEPNPNNITETWEVAGTKKAAGKDFFIIKRSYTVLTLSIVDSLYYCMQGNVLYELHMAQGDQAKTTSAIANFNLAVNESFSSWDEMSYNVTVTEKTAGKTSFFFNAPSANDEEYNTVYLQGVGFYERYSPAWGSGKRLVKVELK